MYLGHYQLKQDPFSGPPDTHIFFPGGGREKVLQHVLEDLANGMTLVHLSGEEGSGKTLLCQLIREKIRLPQTVVLLSESSDTFDDIGRTLALTLGEKDTKLLKGAKLYEKILSLISDRLDNGGSTLFIIDDAEKQIPTDLKRILNLACDTQPRGGVQFVLAGRLALEANSEQFTAIRAESLQQFTYTLQPLDRDDTARYIAFRLAVAGMPDDKQDGVFSAEAVSRIHEATYGNIRLVNILAEEALRNSCKGKSFMVLLDHVKVPSNLPPVSISHLSQPRRTLRKKLVSFIAVVIMATISAYVVVLLDIIPKQRIDEQPAATQEAPSSSAEKLPEPPRTPTVALASPVAALPPAPAATPSPILIPSMHSTTQSASQEATPTHLTVKEIKRKHLSGSEIFNKRKRATQTWRSNKLRGHYTIQILMTADLAGEKKISHTLNDEVYQKAQDHIYILRKQSNPPIIFLYHGIYSSMQEARKARDQLPASIKKHNPFPLAIADAINKKSE